MLRHRAGDTNSSPILQTFFGPTVFLTACLFMLLTGCEDPSNVGSGFVPEEGATPSRVTMSASNVQQTSFASPTGNRTTIVVGNVSDPLFGRVSALGYLDIGSPSSFPEVFSDDDTDISSVVLKLRQSYLYGDTTGTTELVLHDMDTDWPASGTSSDTTLTTGSEITRVTVQPTDTLIEIPMPESWIADHENGLRGERTNFTAEFHGFQLSAPDGRVIQGFNADTTTLDVTVGEETASFFISKELSTLDRPEDPAVLDNRVTLQTGVGPAISMRLPLAADSLDEMVLNRVRLTLPVDRQTMADQLPGNFVRPLPSQLIIYGVDSEDTRTPLYSGQLDEENDQYVFDHPQLTNQLQQVLLGAADYEHYIVAGSTSNAVTVSPVLLYGSNSETQGPSAALTIVPLN